MTGCHQLGILSLSLDDLHTPPPQYLPSMVPFIVPPLVPRKVPRTPPKLEKEGVRSCRGRDPVALGGHTTSAMPVGG